MEIESLIKKITAEIISEFSEFSQRKSIMIFGKKGDVYTTPVNHIIKSGAKILYLGDDWQNCTISRYILPILDLNQMGDLVRGMARGRVAGMVLDTILKGNAVEVAVFGYEQYLETAPESLINLYDRQRRVLAGFGIIPLKGRRNNAHLMQKVLITEKEIRLAADRGIRQLKVLKSACITPLASDLANEKKIEILKQ